MNPDQAPPEADLEEFNAEIATMTAIQRALGPLTKEQRVRVLRCISILYKADK